MFSRQSTTGTLTNHSLPMSTSLANQTENDKFKFANSSYTNTTVFRNPIIITSSSLKFKNDAINLKKLHLTFSYSCSEPLIFQFHRNVSLDKESKFKSDSFYSETIAPTEATINYMSQGAFVMSDELKSNSDFPFALDFLKVVDTVVTFRYVIYCSVLGEGKSLKIHSDMQEVFVKDSWYKTNEVFNLNDKDNPLCELCCEARKDTIIKPCKHFFSCGNCALELLRRGYPCSFCKGKISDVEVLTDYK